MIGRTNANADAILFEHIENIEKVVSVTLPLSGWKSNSSGLYSQEVSVTGMTAQDMPQLLKYTSPSISEDDYAKYSVDFSLITGGQSSNGKITFYAKDILSQSITVYLGMGKKGDGRLLIAGSSSAEKQQISNVVMTITDNAAVAEGGSVVAECNNKSWTSTIKKGKAKLYASEVGNYTITVTALDGTIYTTMLVCPYFGQFSTDIYSGTLQVTCTENGGNGKTCNVRSCDDDYNPTDAYNLTQTFDTSLQLTFLGIPTGKYLVTVDDKYVFFKHIESIQNINSVNVELKQWLYNHGDECKHNTGGWMKCLIDEYTSSISQSSAYSVGNANADITFAEDHIVYICHGSANAESYSTKGGTKRWVRAASKSTTTFGTVQSLKNMKKYNTIQAIGISPSVIATIRTGIINSSTTSISTETILKSGTFPLEITISSDMPYLVVGSILGSGEVYAGNVTASLKYNSDCEITEIFLI